MAGIIGGLTFETNTEWERVLSMLSFWKYFDKIPMSSDSAIIQHSLATRARE